MDRRAYNKLISKDCAEIFCMYDDYNWDWSLNAQSMRCENIGKSAIAKTQFMVMVPCVPRILHTGKWCVVLFALNFVTAVSFCFLNFVFI